MTADPATAGAMAATIDDAIAADPVRRLALEIAEAYRTEADLSAILGLVRRLAVLVDGGRES